MLNINFVPDDYIQNSESRRTNLMYIALFLVVMLGLAGSFGVIKYRQNVFSAKEKIVNEKILKTQESIKQFEELQIKRKAMIKTALATAELIEPVPRSILMALLTNNLPKGVSLSKVSLIQRECKTLIASQTAALNEYKKAQAAKANESGKTAGKSGGNGNVALSPMMLSPEKLLETAIDIEGVASNDIQVASYIEQLSNSSLLENVALVESKETKIQEAVTFRQFKLTAMVKMDVQPTKEEISAICNSTGNFEVQNTTENGITEKINEVQ